MARITNNALRAKWPGRVRWLSDSGTRGEGRLLARLNRSGVFFYYQYFTAEGSKRQLPLGRFDMEGKHGLCLAAARERSAELSKLYRNGVTDLHAYVEQQRIVIEQQQAQAVLARQAEQEAAADAIGRAERRSLRKFLTAYVEHLRGLGKASAKDIANIFKNHVFTDADISKRDATLISTDEFVGLISKVVAAGHGRTAAKLRSYVRAAYALAIRAKTNPAAPQALRDFGIQINPESQNAMGQARLLVGPERVWRLEPQLAKPIALDDWRRCHRELPGEARRILTPCVQEIVETFLATEARQPQFFWPPAQR